MEANHSQDGSPARHPDHRSKIDEGPGPAPEEHGPQCDCQDCQIADLTDEAAELRRRLGTAEMEIEYWKREAQRLRLELAQREAFIRARPKTETDIQTLEFRVKCPGCDTRRPYFLAFRGTVIGNIFTGHDLRKLIDRVLHQGQLKALGLDTPDRLPDNVG